MVQPAIDIKPNLDFSIKTDTIKAIMVANLVPRKGILPFLKILAQNNLLPQLKNLQIDLIGSEEIEPEYAQSCLSFIKKNEVLNTIIRYHGQRLPIEIYSLYLQANLFISTSFMETYGMALQEARAFQLPILALKGGNVENHLKNGKNGWLMEDMNKLVLQLIKLTKTPDLLTERQQNIFRQDKQGFYNWQKAAEIFLEQVR